MIQANDTPVAEFAYDALSRRIKQYDAVADETIRYYYSNNWQVLCEKDDNEDTQRWFVYGGYIDEVLIMIDADADQYYYTHDHLYSPVALVNDEGTVVERYEYDAYGKRHVFDSSFNARSNTQYNNSIGFTGQQLYILDDGNLSGMHYNARDYIPPLGRFLQQDPRGVVPNGTMGNGQFEPIIQYTNDLNSVFSLEGETPIGPITTSFELQQASVGMNLYEYVWSNPAIFLDPFGLWGKDIHLEATTSLAREAGMCVPGQIGTWANAPDTDSRGPEGLAIENFTTTGANNRFLIRKLLAYWHFPGGDQGRPVEPGSSYAYREVMKGIKKCDLKRFSEGLHPLQDSWAHQSPPGRLPPWPPTRGMVGHSRDKKGWYTEHYQYWVWSPDMGQRIQISDPEQRRRDVVLSHAADDASFFRDDAQAAKDATLAAMKSFMDKCPCVITGPRTGMLTRCHN